MAYRQPNERKERSSDMATTSYLEHCLEQVSGLPTKTQEALEQIRQLDDKINSLMSDAQAAATSTIARTNTKATPSENARRSYQDMVQIQKNVTEVSDKKVFVAKEIHDTIETIYNDVERRLTEFEALLKKEGRWPGMQGAKVPVTPRDSPTTQVSPERPAPEKSPRPAPPPPATAKSVSTSAPPTTRASQKSRQKDATNTVSGRATTSTGRPSLRKTSKVPKPEEEEDEDEDEQMEDAETSRTDGGDSGVVDTQLYCVCRNVSHGEMIACEAKNCPYEWYHFECVGLKEAPPQGTSWYCDECKERMKKKSGGARRKVAA